MSKTMTLGNSQEFMQLTNSIRKGLPRTYFYGIIGSYTINAMMIGFFIFPTLSDMVGYWAALIIAAIGTVIIQTFRGLIVFTDLLFAESGQTSKLQVKIVALIMTLVGVFELWHLLSGYTDTISAGQTIGVFIFGSSIIVGGWMMEINFIKQTNEYIYQAQQLPKLGQIEGQNTYVDRASFKSLEDAILSLAAQGQKSGNSPSPLKENGAKKRENNSRSNSESKSGTNGQSLKGNGRGMSQAETEEFDAQYEAQDGLEERLLSQQGNGPLELALNGNFSSNGHHS
jgi:hypothetical protein